MKKRLPSYGGDRGLIYARGAYPEGDIAGPLLYGRGVSDVFDPTTIESLVHRYRASRAEVQVTSGGTRANIGDPVGFVPDEIGTNDLTTSTAAERPTLRLDGKVKYLEFDGTDDYLSTGNWSGGDISTPNIWILCRVRGATEVIFDSTSVTSSRRVQMSNTQSVGGLRFLNGTSELVFQDYNEGQTWATRALIHDSSDNLKTSVNGVLTNVEGSGTADSAGINLGANYIGATPGELDVIELMVFDSELTEEDLANLYLYAVATYGEVLELFNPLSIDALVHRFEAENAEVELTGGTPSTDGDPVGYIPDSVGSDELTAISSGARPVLGSYPSGTKYVQFDGVDDIMVSSFTDQLTAGSTVWTVARWTSKPSLFYDGSTFGDRHALFHNASGTQELRHYADTAANTTNPGLIHGEWINVATMQEASNQVLVYGVTSAASATNLTFGQMNGIRVGDDVSSYNQFWDSQLVEMMVFDRTLTFNELSMLHAYALKKYPELFQIDIDPAEIDGVVCHLDASDSSTMFKNSSGTNPSATGDHVHVWVDRVSGETFNTHSSSTSPILVDVSGYPGVEGDGVDDYLLSDNEAFNVFDSGMTMFLVHRAPTANSKEILTIAATGGTAGPSTSLSVFEFNVISGSGLGERRISTNRASTVAVLGNAVAGTPPEGMIFEFNATGASVAESRADGVLIDDTIAGVGSILPASTYGYLWLFVGVFSSHFDGTIHEVILADDTLSEYDRDRIRIYLRDKWKGILGS